MDFTMKNDLVTSPVSDEVPVTAGNALAGIQSFVFRGM